MLRRHYYFRSILALVFLLSNFVGTNASLAAPRVQNELNEKKVAFIRDILEAKQRLGDDDPETAKRKLDYARFLKNSGLYLESETFSRAALAAYEKRFGADSLEAANAQDLLGRALRHQTRLAEAEVCQRKVLAIREKKLPPNDPAIAAALENLAKVYSHGRENEAKLLYLRALDIANKNGDNNTKVYVLGNLAGCLTALGEYQQARQYLLPLIEQFSKEGDESRYYYASILVLTGQTYLHEKQYDQAREYLSKALEIFRKIYSPDHQSIGVVLRELARCDEFQGRYAQSANEFAEALRIEPRHESNAFGRAAEDQRFNFIANYQTIVDRLALQVTKSPYIPNRSDKNQSLDLSVELATLKTHNANAPTTRIFEMIYNKRVKNLGKSNPITTEAALQMAVMFQILGGDSENFVALSEPGINAFAAKLLTPANRLDIDFNSTVEVLGGRKLALDFTYKQLVWLAYLDGQHSDNSAAEKELLLAEKCLLAKNIGTNGGIGNSHDLDITQDLLSLSKAWGMFGQYEQSRRLIDAVLQTATLKKDAKLTFAALVEKSTLDLAESDLQPAFDNASLAERSGKTLFGSGAHELIPCYRILAQIQLARGTYHETLEAARSGISCKNLSNNDAIFFRNIAGFANLSEGNYKEAKTYLEKALDYCKDDTSNQAEDRGLFTAASTALSETLINLGDTKEALRELDWAFSSDRSNPTAEGLLASARDCAGLARLREMEGDKPLAARYALQAADYTDRFLKNGFSQLSFAQQCAFINVTRQTRNLLLSTCSGSEDIQKAYGYMIKWKGLLLETLRSQSAISAALATEPGAAKKIVNELTSVRTKLSELANGGEVSAGEFNKLTDRKEVLERDLSQFAKTQAIVDPMAEHDVQWFRKLLKPDQAFLDVLTFKSATDNSEHYALIAMKAGNGGEPRLFDLGSRKAIDTQIAAWRANITQQTPTLHRDISEIETDDHSSLSADKYLELTQNLSALFVTNPELVKFLGPGVNKLWLCPEAAMARLPWNSLATICGTASAAICEIDSPREFVQISCSTPYPTNAANKLLLAGVSSFHDQAFHDLPGTSKEINGIKTKADGALVPYDLLMDDQATKTNVCKKLTKSSIAHLSTHGFARGDSAGLEADDTLQKVQFGLLSAPAAMTRNPLTDSGLVLANIESNAVHQPNSEHQTMTNLLTAEEIVGLDLTKCKLVSLSACKTGLGTGLNGQGVIGLRSAILAAGARSILMSLWSVDDQATEQLMQKFYGYLLDRSHPLTEAEALKKAQAEIRAQPQWQSPSYWAGWVLAGDGWQSIR